MIKTADGKAVAREMGSVGKELVDLANDIMRNWAKNKEIISETVDDAIARLVALKKQVKEM